MSTVSTNDEIASSFSVSSHQTRASTTSANLCAPCFKGATNSRALGKPKASWRHWAPRRVPMKIHPMNRHQGVPQKPLSHEKTLKKSIPRKNHHQQNRMKTLQYRSATCICTVKHAYIMQIMHTTCIFCCKYYKRKLESWTMHCDFHATWFDFIQRTTTLPQLRAGWDVAEAVVASHEEIAWWGSFQRMQKKQE